MHKPAKWKTCIITALAPHLECFTATLDPQAQTRSSAYIFLVHGTCTVPNSRSCASHSLDVGVFGWFGGTWKSVDRLQCFLVGHPNEQLFHWTRFMGRLPASLREPRNCPFQPKPKAETSAGPHPPLPISSPILHFLPCTMYNKNPRQPVLPAAPPVQNSYVPTLTMRRFCCGMKYRFYVLNIIYLISSIFYQRNSLGHLNSLLLAYCYPGG